MLLSAGYDAAIGCPEGEMEVTPACYGHLTHMLKSLAGGKLVVVLEVSNFKLLKFENLRFNFLQFLFSLILLYPVHREVTA